MIRLVVNADDLGLHARIDEGIFRAHADGIVTSATLLATGSHAEEAVRRARAEKLPVGVHLCLSTRLPYAAPPGQVPTVAPGGTFRATWAAFVLDWVRRRVRLSEVEQELRAQIARARALGAEPDHLDGHQHLHVLPGIAQIVSRIAREEGLALRWPLQAPRPAWLKRPAAAVKASVVSALAFAQRTDTRRVAGIGLFEAGHLEEGALLGVLEGLAPGDHELGAHPGLAPDRVPEDPQWRYGWEAEVAALCSPRVKEAVARRGIALTSYGAL